jgi:hypothetical protein
MPTGVRGTSAFYKERHGLGDRLAVRLAALLAHKVDLTAAAIECLRDSPALQHAILAPQLLGLAATLDAEKLRSLALPGEELPAPFAVVEEKGWRTIALEEELVAERGTAEPAAAEQSATAGLPSRGHGWRANRGTLPALREKAEVLHPGEIADLFTRRDIAELELVLRTSAEPREKITAIRRLALSPAGDREKLALFATALTDRDAQVRSEAAEALTTLGLDPEVAEDARALAEGSARQKRSAAGRLASRFPNATDTEMAVLLRLVAGMLRYEPEVEVRRLLIRAVEGACRAVARDSRSTRDLIRVLLAQLRDDPETLGPEVRRVLSILGRCTPGDVYCVLQEELATTPDHRVRRLLVAAAVEVAGSDDQHDRVCRQAFDEIAASSDPVVECLPLANALSRMGEPVVAIIGERLLETPGAAQETMVRLLDIVATRRGTTKAAKARIGRLLLLALQRGKRPARLAVVHSLAAADPALSAETRRGLAEELLRSIQEYASPGILGAIGATVAKLGAPALQPVLDVVRRGRRPQQRLAAARILGELVPRLEARHARAVGQAINEILALLDGEFPERATLAHVAGRMCTGPAADEAAVARVVAALRRHILDREVTDAALEGLGRLCLSPLAAPTLKVELVDFFARLLERDLPEIQPATVTRDDEIVYNVGAEVTAYTELVPGLLAGLRNIAATSAGVLRAQALDRLLRTWRAIAEGSLQLGPANTELLLGALHAIGTLPGLPPGERAAIADAVALRRDYLPTCRVLAELCIAAGRAMASRAAALAEQLLQRDATEKQLTETERGTILATLVRLATTGALGRKAAPIRERVVGAVADAEKRGLARASELLGELAASPAIPERLKKRLGTRPPATRESATPGA